MRVEPTGLKATLCVPGPHAPKSMKIIARVYDGRETVEYQFGPHMSLQWIWRQIPIMYTDSKFPPARKVRGITKGEVLEVKKAGKQMKAVMFSDGTIMMREEEAI